MEEIISNFFFDTGLQGVLSFLGIVFVITEIYYFLSIKKGWNGEFGLLGTKFLSFLIASLTVALISMIADIVFNYFIETLIFLVIVLVIVLWFVLNIKIGKKILKKGDSS